MRSSARVELEDFLSPQFIGQDLKLSADLTIFGPDLPEFRVWAGRNGVANVRHIVDPTEYFMSNHEIVAHEFGQQISLERTRELNARIQTLMSRTQRLVLFVDIQDRCTIEAIRNVLRAGLPNLTFRIVYPRGVYKTSGVKVMLIEKRRPRVFLFASAASMVGKTESALWLGDESGVAVVHGDEYIHGFRCGEIPADENVRRNIVDFQTDAPFDREMFAQFLRLIPAFGCNEDVIFDFLIPISKQLAVVEFFDEFGYFPILCLTLADQQQLAAMAESHRKEAESNQRQLEQRLAAMAESHRKEAESSKRQLEADRLLLQRSMSWRLIAPLRWAGRRWRRVTRAAKRSLDRTGGALSSGR